MPHVEFQSKCLFTPKENVTRPCAFPNNVAGNI